MLKGLLIIVLGVLFLQDVQAQKQDTLLYYMKNSGEVVSNKDKADYFLFIMPRDQDKLYPVVEVYPNGKNKLVGKSFTKTYSALMFDGPCITYFPNGHRKRIANYENGEMKGGVVRYYPDGKLYNTMDYNPDGIVRLIECRDSVGNVLAEKGNGKWIAFDFDKKRVVEEGSVKDSLQDGEWKETLDRGNYLLVYNKGVMVSSTDPYKPVNKQGFVIVEKEPVYKNGGEAGFNEFLKENIRYPENAKKNQVQGRVIVTFFVEKDGTLTNIKALRGPGEGLNEEAVRVVGLSPPWMPGIKDGKPVRVQFTIPVNFGLAIEY